MQLLIVLTSLLCVLFKGYANQLDFDSAWQRVVLYSPSIGVAEAEVCALEGEAQQMSLRPNPIFEIEAENLGISHPTEDTEPPQSTYSISQLVELGGKRQARWELASSVKNAAFWESQIVRLDLMFALKRAFIETKLAQEKVTLVEQRVFAAEQALEAILRQIEGGKASPLQEKKGRMRILNEKIALREAQGILDQSRKRISAMWGDESPDFEDVCFELFDVPPPPEQKCIFEQFFHSPDFLLAKQMMCSAAKNVKLQKANRIPDVNFTIGYRTFHDSSNSGGLVVGAAMPLPVFDRNQGFIKSALYELSQSEYKMNVLVLETQEKINLIYEKMCALFQEVDLMRNGILNEALETYYLTEDGYKKGKIEYLELLEAKKMLCEVQESYLNLLLEYHMNWAELSRLSGVNL